MTTTRGSWTVGDAVFARWQSDSLDAKFKQQPGWLNVTDGEFLVFNVDEARPCPGPDKHPLPYCIYEQMKGTTTGNSSGASSVQEIQSYQEVPIQFTVYGSTRDQAKEMAKLVAQAFDRGPLNLQDDALIDIVRDPDFYMRQDDEVWAWVLPYRIQLDITYAGPLLPG
jgi:hypothetical protein